MSKFNAQFFINTYSDRCSTNAPNLQNVRWVRDISGVVANNPLSEAITLAPGESRDIFAGQRTLAQDGTTEYTLALKPLSSNTYVLSWSGGTNPVFRTARSISSDATTQVTVTKNGPLLTFASTAGTAFNFASVVIGDNVRIGSLFNIANRGSFVVLAKTATSFTIENQTGVAEGPITLGAGFADQVSIYSAAGVQINDTLEIFNGFSVVSRQTFKITDVGASYVEFYSTEILPEEVDVNTQGISIYSFAKKFLYLESSQPCQLTMNETQNVNLSPLVVNNSINPALFLTSSAVFSLTIQNLSLESSASIFLISIE